MRALKHLFHSLPSASRGLLVYFAVLALGSLVLGMTTGISLLPFIWLSGPEFWHGQVWRIVTHGCFPVNVIDFIVNGLLIAFVGAWVEVRSSRWIILAVSLAGILGAGLVKVLVQPRVDVAIGGIAPIGFALLAAWIKLCGNEEVQLITTTTKVWLAGMIFSVLSLAMVFFSCSPVQGLITACAWPSGWAFLWCHDRFLRARSARMAGSNRIGRLEI